MQDERRNTVIKIRKAVGIVAGTCMIAVGAFFLTDTSLAFLNTKIEKTKLTEELSESVSETEKYETEQSETEANETERVVKTADSFTIWKKQSKQTVGKMTESNQSSETNLSETNPSQTNQPQINQPETNPSQINQPQINQPETNPPQINSSETNLPETEAPQIEAPEVDVPEIELPVAEEPSLAWDDTYVFPDTAIRYIERHELDQMTEREIEIARNEIFARHGRIFNTQEWRDYFAAKTWYVPLYDAATFDSMDLLNEYEKKNLKFILEYEEER